RPQVLALEVLDERDLERVTALAHDRREAVQASQLRRPEAALAGKELIAALRAPAYHDGLKEAALQDRCGQLRELVLGKISPWLRGVGLHRCERNDRQNGPLPAPHRSSDRQRAARAFGPGHVRQHAPPPPNQLRSPPGSGASRLPHAAAAPAGGGS